MTPFDPHDEVSADDVQNAVDDADGKHDGDIVHMPESDVDAVLLALDRGVFDEETAMLNLLRIVVAQPGANEGSAAAWARAGLRLGPALVGGIISLARKLGGL